MQKILLLATLTLLSFSCIAQNAQQNIEKKKYFTQRISTPIKLDGILDDKAWENVDWGGDFIQYQPAEGKAPSQPTKFKIVYDDKFLYIGYRCFDAAPDSIVRRMSRRDQFPGDWVEINIDSYHDLRSAFSFTTSVSGVRGDEFISNNGNDWDTNWNPIWFAKTHLDSEGWTAEIKIPFSQLRYGKEEDKVWGFQVMRRIFRKEERSTWQYIPQNAGVWVSGFGELHGLKGVKPQKQIEIAPYTVAKMESYKAEEGNPFATGLDKNITFGVDGKVAVTSNLILDYTINPDFGQVEADPSQIRIDGFQNFFEERRPFFMESRNIFDYQLTGSAAGGDYDSDLLFYSRRIGASPHGYPNLQNGEFSKMPSNARILGAAKFSGKTEKGWSIGLLESITQRVAATIDNNGEKRKENIEPLTNYVVGRLQKDINGGQTVLGGIVTSVQREHNLNHQLHNSATSAGFDFLHFWKNRTWYFRGNLVASHVTGSKEKILDTQRSFEHLFQRTNAKEVKIDENRTSLTGTGGTFRLGKGGGKSGKLGQVFKFETGLTYRSPELEINDIGFMLTANEINHYTWAGLQFQKQIGIFRNARVNYNHFFTWDFAGQQLLNAYNANVHGTFKNNWRTGTGGTWLPLRVSNNALRGGSALRLPEGINQWAYLESDSRKKISFNFNVFNFWGFENTARQRNIDFGIITQPLNAMTIRLGIGYSNNFLKEGQFVDEVNFQQQKRVIVGELNQKTLRFTARFNYNITPDLTLQYYGQPFITRPLYSNFAYIADPLNKDFESRFHRFSNDEINFNNGIYLIDENKDGKTDYSFSKPDFNFVQFRSNLVARWEYKAGSELFLVWSQGNTPDAANDFDRNVGNSLFSNLFAGQGRNIFLIKLTYRFLK